MGQALLLCSGTVDKNAAAIRKHWGPSPTGSTVKFVQTIYTQDRSIERPSITLRQENRFCIVPPLQATSWSTAMSKLKVLFPRPNVHIPNQVISVVRQIKATGFQAHKAFHSSSMLSEGRQTKSIVNLVFVALERHAYRTNRIRVPKTIGLCHIPTTVLSSDVGIALHTSRIIRDNVPTI